MIKKEIIYKGHLQTYKQVKILGEGSQGRTYLVQGLDDNKYYCLKKIQLRMYKEKELKFMEQRIMRLPKHRQLLKVYECFEEQLDLFQIMEYCEGGDLANLIQNNPIHEKSEIIKIILDIAKQLETIHQMGFVFQDLKPSNIVFKKAIRQNEITNVYKICDFGSLIIHDKFLSKQQKGKTQSRIATPHYQAPETFLKQNQKTSQDFPIDIWSLGVVIFQLFSRTKLFIGQNDFEILENIENYVGNQCDIHKKININIIDKDVSEMIKKMIDPNPQKRPQIQTVIEFFQTKKNYYNKLFSQQNKELILPFTSHQQEQNHQQDTNPQLEFSSNNQQIKDINPFNAKHGDLIQLVIDYKKEINNLQYQLVKAKEYIAEKQDEIKELMQKVMNKPPPFILCVDRQSDHRNIALNIIQQIGIDFKINISKYLEQLANF